MKIIEKFTSFNEFNIHFRNIFDQMLPMNEHLYYILFHPKYFEHQYTTQLIRDYYANGDLDLHQEIVDLCRDGYIRAVHENSGVLLSTGAIEQIDELLKLIMNGDNLVSDPYRTYLFPWTRSKFIEKFYTNIFPSYVREYLSILTESGHILFKKTFTMVTDMPFSDEIQRRLMNDQVSHVLQIDFTQVVSDLNDNVDFYRRCYEGSERRVRELEKVIEQMSERINAQSLTRWY